MIMQKILLEKLLEAFQPDILNVFNDSHLHAGHAGDNGTGETHYRIVIQSSCFAGKTRLERERMVHKVLAYEIPKIHALSLDISAE